MRLFFLVLRLFIAFFLTLLGIAVLAKTESEGQMLAAAVLASLGLTFLFLLWAAQRKNA